MIHDLTDSLVGAKKALVSQWCRVLDISRSGLYAARHRARTLMRANGLRARWRRKFIHTTDSRHTLPVAANVLDCQFKPNAPDRAWVSDITYQSPCQY